MGKMIVSWSPISGQGGTTSNIASLAARYALTSDAQSLITHTQLKFSSLELLFGKEKLNSLGFEDNGIVALERLSKSGLLKADAITDYMETIYRGGGKLDLLGSSLNSQNISTESFNRILQVVNDVYDLVWIDANSGNDDPTVQMIVNEADVVLVNLPQNRFVLDEFFLNSPLPSFLNQEKVIYLIGKYDDDVNFSIRKIKRQYKVKEPIFPIYYSRNFKDASNNKNLTELFYYATNPRKESSLGSFIDGLEKINEHISKTLGFQKAAQREEDGS